MGYGVNETRLIEIMFKELEFPKPLTLSDKYSCKYDDMAFDLNGIDQINGDESLESLQYEIGKQAFDIVMPLFENMDSYSETETSYNQNVWRVQNKVVLSFGNSSLSIYFDVDSETDVSIIYKLFSEAKRFLNSVVSTDLMNELSIAPEVLPLDLYKNIALEVAENQYEDSFYEASERFIDSFEDLGIDLDSGRYPGQQKIYKISFGLNWSDQIFREIAYASGGTIDAGLLAAKGLIVNKMNKYEIQMLLQSAGLDRNLQGLYLDYAYTLYDQIYEQAKIFINNPKGILLELEFPLGLDQEIFYEIEKNPMMAFNVLNNMEFSITANPIFRN